MRYQRLTRAAAQLEGGIDPAASVFGLVDGDVASDSSHRGEHTWSVKSDCGDTCAAGARGSGSVFALARPRIAAAVTWLEWNVASGPAREPTFCV